MSFKRVIDNKNKNPYDLSKISYRCEVCSGKKRPASIYEMSVYERYCYCDKKRKFIVKKLEHDV